MKLAVCFAHNPTGWQPDGPIRGGMSDVHIAPVARHLTVPYIERGAPARGAYVNVYYTHRHTYRVGTREGGRVSVFAGHGIADKAWRNADRMSRRFDWTVTSGPAWTDRLHAAGYSNVLEVGYPKLDPIFNNEVPSAWPARDGRIRVLWAPTHGGGGEQFRWTREPPNRPGAKRSSHWHADLIRSLLPPSEFQILEAIHPRHRPDGLSTLGEYVGADVVIADGGSTIYEAWALGLPVVFPSWLTAEAHLARKAPTMEADIYRERIGRHADTPEELPRFVVEATYGITGPEARLAARVFPGKYRGFSGARFAAYLDELAERQEVTDGDPGRYGNHHDHRSSSTGRN